MVTEQAHALAKLVSSHWEILEHLYRAIEGVGPYMRGRSPSELALEIKKLLPNISVGLKELGGPEARLVYYTKEKDQRIKRYMLTKRGILICSVIIDLSEPTGVDKVQSNVALQLIKQIKLKSPYENRVAAAHKLREICSHNSQIVGDKGDIRKFFSEVMENMKAYIKKGEKRKGLIQVLYAMQYYLGYQLADEEDLKWLEQDCVPKLLSENDWNAKVREYAVEALLLAYGRLVNKGWSLDLSDKLQSLFKKIFFDPKEKEKLADRCWEVLWLNSDKTQREILTGELCQGEKSKKLKLRKRCQKHLLNIMI